MAQKREVRTSYFEGARAALDEHLAATERGIRALKGVSEEKADKIIRSVRQDHKALLERLDSRAAKETRVRG